MEDYSQRLPIADPERASFPAAEYWARSTVVKEPIEGKGKVSEEEPSEGKGNEEGKDKGKKKRKLIEGVSEEVKAKGKGKGKGKKKGIEEEEDIGLDLNVEDLSVDKVVLGKWPRRHISKGPYHSLPHYRGEFDGVGSDSVQWTPYDHFHESDEEDGDGDGDGYIY
ncbi:hypothetical protein POM88_000277 [Heracleum sosnowskyi]|uniref:Uncharacterized protein n=1 Tax=Heracleum sosnowskyi TaxID=360622 RepID=A0AAD8JAD8_9APIA|nr:hypothetical protein POM88_000277 [Heracleum sosnowskyi]